MKLLDDNSRSPASTRLATGFCAALVVLVLPVVACAELIVQLRANPVVDSRQITLADVADISATTNNEAVIAGQIDLADLENSKRSLFLNRSFVRIRLMVAGWDSSELRVSGPEKILVEYEEPEPLADTDIEIAATRTMQQMLGVPEEELRIRLASPFVSALPTQIRERPDLRVEVMPPSSARLGTSSLNVMLWDGGNLLLKRAGRFEVLRRHRVAVTRVSLQRESTIEKSNVQFENRFLATRADEPTEEDIYGQRVRTNLGPGEVLSLRDVVPPAQQRAEVVVKRRSKVRVTAVSGALRVRLRQAEALEDGHVGDFISLRNLDSKEVITARVVAPGQAEIKLR